MPPKAKQPKMELPTASPDAPPVVSASALLATPRRTLPPHPSRIAVGGGPTRTWSAPCFSRVPRGSKPGDFRLSRLPSYVRALEMIAPDFEPSAPIRLPDKKPAPAPPAAAADGAASDDAAPAAEDAKPAVAAAEAAPAEASPKPDVDVAATPAATATATATARIKLRDGWGYKIGGTRFRAVFDPERKAIPKLPERPPGGYEVVGLSVKKEGGEGDGDSHTKKPAISLYVNSFPDPKLSHRATLKKMATKRSNTAPTRIGEYYQGIDRDAALAVKQCYDERLAEDPSSFFAALVRIITVEQGARAPTEEHAYLGRPKCEHTAEIVTTFPLDQAAHYRKKKYKDDHVVIDSTELEDIYNEVHRIRMNRRRWARIKDRCAADATFAAKMRAKKIRGYAAEKAKIAAMSEEERKAINVRKYAYHKARKLEVDPEQTAKKQRLEERRAANLARNKALLAAGVDDPEERRRLQRRIRQAERTPEERRELQLRDVEYQRRKKAWLANATPEQLAAFQEAKRAKRAKHAALAGLSPKERMRVQQREYHANYTARQMRSKGPPMPRARASTSPAKKTQVNKRKQDMRSVLDRAMKEEEEDELEEDDDDNEDEMVDVMGVNDDDDDGVDYGGGGGFEHGDDGDGGGSIVEEEEENQMAARAIASPSPTPPPPPSSARNRGMPAPRPAAPSRHHQPSGSSSVFNASINYAPLPRYDDDADHDVMGLGRSPQARIYRPPQPQPSHHRQHLQPSNYGQQQQAHQPHRYGGYIEIPEPSRVSARFGGDLEAELLQLQKDVAWSDKAIHNSRVEAERLRAEAESLESAIEEELHAQVQRKNRIARLMADWRDEHGEDSQG
ncbi:hypothetical protein PRIPAC_84845 [Pristionchus pacificus]|uniref:Uncharacterized protein n=1 Tax=Pristionchus pacificus TaxID=54126 RepID=A0A2A6BLB6_PRIPA|nr:hypothetical protein PRIPAC_84845 [Pristionchus pacificus]|eukprot:PDM66699.1 hypothetical protein PRIPAC_48116 [Pristionchus pacificus]